MSLTEFIELVYPLLVNRTVTRIEQDCAEGYVTAYWAGAIIRVDIKPVGD